MLSIAIYLSLTNTSMLAQVQTVIFVVCGLCVTLLSIKQVRIEANNIIDPAFKIDEIEHRINHYFKRK
jgi:hypothetical protein